jgi:hypothetical protein
MIAGGTLCRETSQVRELEARRIVRIEHHAHSARRSYDLPLDLPRSVRVRIDLDRRNVETTREEGIRYHALPACPILHVSHSFLLLRSYVTDSVFSDVVSRLKNSGESSVYI